MASIPRFRICVGIHLGAFAFAVGAALAADSPPDAPRPPEVIPSRRATKLLIHNTKPDYPSIAKINYIQGKVSVQAFVNDSGQVNEAHVLKGHPFLAVAALKAIRGWLFKPAQARPGPPSFLTYVDVNFSLQTRRLGPFPDTPEADLNRQVHPPQLVSPILADQPSRSVRMRVLVGADGRALDAVPVVTSSEGSEAQRAVADWTFRPARWGAVAVPWYLEVNVPVGDEPSFSSSHMEIDQAIEPAKAR